MRISWCVKANTAMVSLRGGPIVMRRCELVSRGLSRLRSD
jgi:hypothetical protein